MDIPKPRIDNPFVGGGAMWQSSNPPAVLPKKDSENLSKEKTYESGKAERERIKAIPEKAKQSIQKEEENDSDVKVALVPGGDNDGAPDTDSREITAEDFTLVA
jgi:hypothetical protein